MGRRQDGHARVGVTAVDRKESPDHGTGSPSLPDWRPEASTATFPDPTGATSCEVELGGVITMGRGTEKVWPSVAVSPRHC